MRIGKVSEKYGISIDNLHYYINYGLLVPPKPKGQYVFDDATLKDLEWILNLKKLDFSLPLLAGIRFPFTVYPTSPAPAAW